MPESVIVLIIQTLGLLGLFALAAFALVARPLRLVYEQLTIISKTLACIEFRLTDLVEESKQWRT